MTWFFSPTARSCGPRSSMASCVRAKATAPWSSSPNSLASIPSTCVRTAACSRRRCSAATHCGRSIQPARMILKDLGGFNGFDIGPDGKLYGPLWFKHQVVRIDPDTGKLDVIAEGFDTPAAANFDSKWNLYVLDTARGQLVRVDIRSGKKQVVAKLATSLDNLAIDS